MSEATALSATAMCDAVMALIATPDERLAARLEGLPPRIDLVVVGGTMDDHTLAKVRVTVEADGATMRMGGGKGLVAQNGIARRIELRTLDGRTLFTYPPERFELSHMTMRAGDILTISPSSIVFG